MSAVSNLLLTALNVRLKSGPTPPPALITRLTLSASVAIRWWPKALRATAEAELDQGMEPSETLATQALLDLLFLVSLVRLCSCDLPLPSFECTVCFIMNSDRAHAV